MSALLWIVGALVILLLLVMIVLGAAAIVCGDKRLADMLPRKRPRICGLRGLRRIDKKIGNQNSPVFRL